MELSGLIKQPLGRKATHKQHSAIMAVIIAIGIVYGDIGTSPLYVIKAIISGRVIDPLLVYGGLSCIFWTLTLQTTLKYVVIVLRADRRGQGGLLSLYSIVKKGKRWWLVFFAMAGASMLLSEGLITPAISVSSAVEGLRILYPQINTLPIVITILLILFFIQRFGTNIIGGAFGAVMIVWFSMLGSFGFVSILQNSYILKAINPIYAVKLLTLYPNGFWLLGAVFLCTTGAEALYSDLGHCSRKSIRAGWVFVKTALLLNYFGQGAWLLRNIGQVVGKDVNPFYSIIPEWFLLPSIIISTAATIIASQALISGSFSLINEATRINLWPKFLTKYPTTQKGQIYIPLVNTFLCIGCIGITYYFKESSNMEAAYGLAVVTTMINTTILFSSYLRGKGERNRVVYSFMITFLIIEFSFLAANMAKFTHGGWIIFAFGSFLFFIMWVWYQAKIFKRRHTRFTDFYEILPLLIDLSSDNTVSKTATHLIYMTSSDSVDLIETKIMYSLLERQPKRADMYWFVHVEIVDEPYLTDYKATILSAQDAVRVDFRLGFKVEPRINVFFKKVLEELITNNEINVINHYEYKKRQNIFGDISFVILRKFVANHTDLPFYQRFIVSTYYLIRRFALTEDKAYGLDDEPNSIIIEQVPMVFKSPVKNIKLNRVYE